MSRPPLLPDRFPLRSVKLLIAAGLTIAIGAWLASRVADIEPSADEPPTEENPAGVATETSTLSEASDEPQPGPGDRLPASASEQTVRIIESPDPERSPLADRLNAPGATIQQDGEILLQILENFRLELGGNPVGDNPEITAQLSGRNTRSHAPLPPDVPAIDAAGNLLDRWGTPFFFHALSAHDMEIRSAGPDRAMHTQDDFVFGRTTPEDAEAAL